MCYKMLIYLASQQDKENPDSIEEEETEVNNFTESTKVPNLILYKVNVTVVIVKVVTMATLY